MNLLALVKEDLANAYARDPAASNTIENFLCYSGLHAIWMYRISHRLWSRGYQTTARILSQIAKMLTGVEIHPGATIGRRLFIDHGTGIVVGATAVIGDDVMLYQGVTLGGTRLEKTKRHPTIGDRVMIGAGAKLLGDIEIGCDSAVGANAVVTRNMPANSIIVGIPASPRPRGEKQTKPLVDAVCYVNDMQNNI